MIITLSLIGGLLLLFYGGDMLVDGAVKIAKHFGMSELLIGITLVGFGTSTPELMTSILAAFDGLPGIAVGNVVGSNTANILLILGIAALIYPLACDKKTWARDGGFMVGASFLFLAACFYGSMTLWMGIVFLATLVSYITYCVVTEIRAVKNEERVTLDTDKDLTQARLLKNIGWFILGLILTFIGAHLLVNGSVDLARMFGISETIIGLTIVAIGTSMPELVASAVAALKKNTDIAYGNIIGSNIYNILGIMGVTAILHPFVIPQQIMSFDIWVMIGATLLLTLFSAHKWLIHRWKGAVFVTAYVAYIIALIFMALNTSAVAPL